MPRPGFYNDNEYRAYPFELGSTYASVGLPDSAVVDAGVIMGLLSEFEASSHSVWLSSVTRTNDTFTFVFETDAPGVNTPLVFTRSLSDEDWQNEYVTGGENWEGFLVTGPLTALADFLPPGTTITLPIGARILEPARIQSLVRSYLRAVSVGNYSRITSTPTGECAGSETTPTARYVVINAENLQGPIELKEGYNCRILQSDYDQKLQVTAQRGAGAPQDADICENGSQIPLYVGEPLPEGSKFYSGGPACDEVILTINGVNGKNINIAGGTGVKITTDAETSTITVELAANNVVGNCGAGQGGA